MGDFHKTRLASIPFTSKVLVELLLDMLWMKPFRIGFPFKFVNFICVNLKKNIKKCMVITWYFAINLLTIKKFHFFLCLQDSLWTSWRTYLELHNLIFDYPKHRTDQSFSIYSWSGTYRLRYVPNPILKNKVGELRISTSEEVGDAFNHVWEIRQSSWWHAKLYRPATKNSFSSF